jgi:hypothetical protein
MHHTVEFTFEIHTHRFSHLFFEILSEKDILRLATLGVSDEAIEYAKKNLHKKGKERKKLLSSFFH